VIEAEQRHHAYPLQNVFDEVLRHRYAGFFVNVRERAVCPLAAFDGIAHQGNASHGTRSYVANFIFLPGEEAEMIRWALQKRLFPAT
jgi:hypothetical protein